MRASVARALVAPSIAIAIGLSITATYAACPERPPCHGCGCKGGPGYRAPDRHCVGFRELDQICGNPPSRCTFENAPGTGANRECALKPQRAPQDKAVQ